MSQPVTNEQNQVALKYRQPLPVIAKNTPSHTEYVFSVKANLSIAWINHEDVADLLRRKNGCNCGGTRRLAFRFASEDDVRRWSNGGGR